MFVTVENLGIESKFKKGFEKGDMHVVITIGSTTILSSIFAFHLELVPMFFHMDSIRESISTHTQFYKEECSGIVCQSM
jgi:hypothetical protein